ncbi:MAG TPA: AI-2E family transporter [Patescibacteria group bacterium]|nr:AI-2E family transporter [Patescibacteria group bacterium]
MVFHRLENSTKIILKVLLVVFGLVFLWLVRDIVIILLLSFVLASAMEPLVDYLHIRKIPRALTVFLVYAFVLGVFGFIFSLIIPVVVEQVETLSENLPQYLTDIQQKFPLLQNFLGSGDLVQTIQDFFSTGENESFVFSQTASLIGGVFTFFTTLVISFYLVAEEQGMKKFIHTLVPKEYIPGTLSVVMKIQRKMGNWVLGQLVLSIVIFLVTWVSLLILGVPYALFLALLAGCFELIPYIGPTISAVPAIAFAFMKSPTTGILAILLYVAIQKMEGLVLVPKVMEKAVGVSPLVILLALLIGFKLAGIAGLLLAVPMVGILTVFIEEYNSSK